MSVRPFFLAYNGEIYNCEQIRRDLISENAGVNFRGHSDTEVMLAGFEHWGIEPALERMNGMFSFALWDRRERDLPGARPVRRETSLLWLGRNNLPVRLRVEGPAGSSGVRR